MLTPFINFMISILIGLLIGIEREHSQGKGTQAFGVRTFILFSLAGTLAATLNQIVITATISLFVFSMIILGYYRSTENKRKNVDIGATTEISAAIIFCLGYIIPSAHLLAIMISAFVLLILFERNRLHALARKKFKPHEIETTIILLVFALGIVPLLPNSTIDPWNVFNPRNFGILLITIAGIQFAGYIFIQLFGERFGMAITGFLGGLVSSTAVFANLNPTLRAHPTFKLSIIAAAIFAVFAMLMEVLIILLVASRSLFYIVAKPILIMGLVSMSIGIFLLYFQKTKIHVAATLSNPLNLKSILYTTFFIAMMLATIAIAKNVIGKEAVLVVSFLGGLFEIHGITLATSLLYLDHYLTINSVIEILYIAILATFVSKLIMLFSLTPFKFALQTSFFLFLIIASGALTYCLY